jgi:hypothetical protein
MMQKNAEYTLEFLLDFNGRIHCYEKGYWVKFEITQSIESELRPHGLNYSFTLHNPSNLRLMGFDNAHPIAGKGSNHKARQIAMDHWHRTEKDKGRPYEFKDAETLIDDFFNEVERVLTEHGVSLETIKTTEGNKP